MSLLSGAATRREEKYFFQIFSPDWCQNAVYGNSESAARSAFSSRLFRAGPNLVGELMS
jgi:hypothetical protein